MSFMSRTFTFLMMSIVLALCRAATLEAHYRLNGNGDEVYGSPSAVNYGAIPTTDRHGVENSAMLFSRPKYMTIPHSNKLNTIFTGTHSFTIWIRIDGVCTLY